LFRERRKLAEGKCPILLQTMRRSPDGVGWDTHTHNAILAEIDQLEGREGRDDRDVGTVPALKLCVGNGNVTERAIAAVEPWSSGWCLPTGE
jgi:hypothetical protein